MVILIVLKIVFFFHVYKIFFEKRPCTTLFHLNFSFALLQRVHSWVYKHWKWGGWWTHPGGGRFHPHLHVLQLVQDHLIRVTKCKINHVLISLAASLIIKTTFLTDVIYIFVMFLKVFELCDQPSVIFLTMWYISFIIWYIVLFVLLYLHLALWVNWFLFLFNLLNWSKRCVIRICDCCKRYLLMSNAISVNTLCNALFYHILRTNKHVKTFSSWRSHNNS